MASEALNKYIKKRYDRWLDYAKYHCSLAGMSSEAIDVLNEVMCMLLQKPLEHLSRLMEAKQGKYTELDWYILQMIKLNVTSDTSPYRHKYKPIPVDENVDWRRLNIIDEPDDSIDRTEYIRERMQDIRDMVDLLGLSEKPNGSSLGNFLQENLLPIGRGRKAGRSCMRPIKVFSMR